MNIETLLHKITGRQHQYQVTMAYVPKHPCRPTITKTYYFGVTGRKFRTFDRDLKKAIGPKFLEVIPKRNLNNGRLEARNLSYLGWFK